MTKHQRTACAGVLVSLALLLAGSLSGCGRPAANASPKPSVSPSMASVPVEAEVVAFQLVGGVPKYATVLEDRDDVLGYAGRLGTTVDDSAALQDRMTGYLIGQGKALLAFHSLIGCDTAESVELRRAGDDFSIRYVDVTEHEECVAPKSTISIFAVDRSTLPASPTLAGSQPSPAAIAELVGFQRFDLNKLPLPEVTATEISQPDQAERFFAQFPDRFATLAAEVDEARRAQGSRMFAFPVSGCQSNGAVLVIEPTRLYATPTGGENIRCVMAEHYIAVFVLDADDVPVDARLAG